MENKRELWDLFTAKEEYNPAFTDLHGRKTHWASRNRDIFVPVVSEFLLKNGLVPKYPDGKKFALCISHDIDKLYDPKPSAKRQFKTGVKSLLSLNMGRLSATIKAGLKHEINPSFHVSETIKHGKKYGAKSSFYFMSLTPGEQDFNYDPALIPEIFDMVSSEGGEIGLHGGHQAYNNLQKIKEEKARLEKATGKSIIGYRNHFLKFNTPDTWEYLEAAGFQYDTTFGYADCSGFRNGMCHPFQPYSNNKGAFLNLMELPLIIMDTSISGYMRMDEQTQLRLCKTLIDTVAKNSGVLTLLWHNTEMHGKEGAMYAAILQYAHEQGAWMTNANEIIDHWKENKYHETTTQLLQQLKDA